MEALLGIMARSLEEGDACWAYALLLLSAFLENVVPPVPGDTVVVFSAYLVGRGALELLPVFLATCVGGTLGFMAMYCLGRRYGRAFFQRRGGRFFSAAALERAEAWLQRYGAWLLLANRFLSGIRSVIAIGAGIGAMHWGIVALCGALSMLVWNGLLFYLGLLVGQNWQQVVELLRQYNRVLLALVVCAALWMLWRWRRRVDKPSQPL